MAARRLVLDANILIRAVLGKRVKNVIATYAVESEFFVPEVAYDDAERHLPAVLTKFDRVAEIDGVLAAEPHRGEPGSPCASAPFDELPSSTQPATYVVEFLDAEGTVLDRVRKSLDVRWTTTQGTRPATPGTPINTTARTSMCVRFTRGQPPVKRA